jgi:hypothetical protein
VGKNLSKYGQNDSAWWTGFLHLRDYGTTRTRHTQDNATGCSVLRGLLQESSGRRLLGFACGFCRASFFYIHSRLEVCGHKKVGAAPQDLDRDSKTCPCGQMGWALFIGTPKGQNHFKELRDRAETEEDWALLEFKASETNILPETELAAARKEMGDDKYFQEFECSFSAAVEGSYYGTILNELAEERFKEIPRDDLCKTFAAGIWGWGTLRQYGLSKSRAKRSELWTTLRITVRA